MQISSNFDSGNIEVLRLSGTEAELAIRRDQDSEFFQWFHFRVTGALGVPLVLKIMNAGQSAYPDGWPGYQARVSTDRKAWTLAATDYHAGVLTIRVTPEANSIWLAYFAPYSMERHHDLVARIAAEPGVRLDVLGQSLDGQDLDMLSIGEPGAGKKIIWLLARQHPGESMAEWWMEGALERLVDLDDPVTAALRQRCVFHIVPNMNPDGSRRGHLRTNAVGVNLNREWEKPSLAKSPEVYHVLHKMIATGCDFNLDVHGDEALPHNFIAGFDGIPSLTPRMTALLDRYKAALAAISPDFQTKYGYPVAKPGQANMSMSTNALAERFGCLAMTLEMPFKDAAENPDPVHGWSPTRAKHLGRACLDALLHVVDDLR
jgi:murein tripeptide amidase MpaA